MTAKEKAKELVSKFTFYQYPSLAIVDNSILLDNSKQCALICIDEILESHYKVLVGVMPKVYDYWQEVTEEINKL
tara:strand:- start:1404 stop:1628 length:225 start_codon:yes stop_codon:yes gene_type:complete